VACARASTAEVVEFSRAKMITEADPIVPGQSAIGLVMLSPLVISHQNRTKSDPRWHNDLTQVDLSAAINARLSRLAGREVRLVAQADRLYLRSHPRHDVLVQTKQMSNGNRAFVIGMRAPLVLQGSEEDLLLAWYAGIGEKTRNGFGCVGLAERGIGR
jgi:CRISPR-associated endoribonuclease Cas6